MREALSELRALITNPALWRAIRTNPPGRGWARTYDAVLRKVDEVLKNE